MTKSILRVQYEYPFEVAGIVSSAKDYRLCHFLNKELHRNFKREDDRAIIINKQGDSSYFAEFSDDSTSPERHYLLSNKGNNNWFFPEIKNVDYIYIVHWPDKLFVMEDLLVNLRQFEIINAAYQIDFDKYKSKDNLLFLS